MLIGQVKETEGDCHRQGLIALQREEPDAGISIGIVNIGADVEFHEPREPWDRRHANRAHSVHEKRHHAEPRAAFERIDMQARRQSLRNARGIHRPVQE